MQAGPLTKVTICKDREGKPKSFGFVCFKHPESVSYAIALLNGIRLYGRPIKVQYRFGRFSCWWNLPSVCCWWYCSQRCKLFFLLCFLCYNLRPKKCSCSLLKFIHNVMNYEHIHNVMWLVNTNQWRCQIHSIFSILKFKVVSFNVSQQIAMMVAIVC